MSSRSRIRRYSPMKVTQHARFTALFRLLWQNGVVGIQDRVPFHRLEQEWRRFCGLRRADLTNAVEELTGLGAFRRHDSDEGPVIELTDRGVFRMQYWLQRFAGFTWHAPIGSLGEQVNTHHVLWRARQRTEGWRAAANPAPGERRIEI